MEVFVCWDGDKIGRRVGRAVLANDVGEVRRVDQAINAGNELWRALALGVGGSVIEIGGDEGRVVFDASHLGDMPRVAEQYAQLVGATVSVGVGMKMSDSAMALVVAKLRGGNQILVWDPDTMAAEYQAAVNAPKSEREKIEDEYLAKADTPEPPKQQSAGGKDIANVMEHNTAKLTGPNAGFAVQHEPGFTDMKPGDAGGAPAPAAPAPPVEQTNAAGNMEDMLHSAAEDQSKQDEQNSDAGQKQTDDVKKKVTDALVKIRKQLPAIQQLGQYSPDAYKAIIGLIQGVILLGKEVAGDGPPMDDEPQAIKEAMSKAEESKDEEKTELPSTPPASGEMQMSEMPEKQPEHHKDLPVGIAFDGKVKVRHADGTKAWKQVHTGMVQGQEAGAPLFGANSHPVSSREPSAH